MCFFGSSVPVCVSSWEGRRLCQCGVIPVGRGSSVLVWCDSSWEGVVCASVEFLRIICASICVSLGHLCQCVFPAGRGSSVPVCVSSWKGVVCASVV